MSCLERLSEFVRPYKWGAAPCLVSQLNYDTNVIETVELLSGFNRGDGCSDGIHLYWLNTRGGVDNFLFSARHSKLRGITDGKRAVSGSSAEFYFDKGTTRKFIEIESQPIFAADVPALMTLLSSPWVWWSDSGTNRPVNIEEGEYTEFNSAESKLRVSFRMSLSQLFYTQLR